MKRTILLYCGLALLCCSMLTGCGVGPYDSTLAPATLGYDTNTRKDLLNLPKPKGKIVVAVYNIKDQSGQYKFSQTTSTFSTAVTQGATSMLIKALTQSGWFIPVERESLNNLLTERKIIRAKLDDDGPGLPRLMHAPLLLDGAIVAYETNVHTGGMGAEYTGIGASGQYRKDQVTLYLRAVNVMSGEILQSVSATKSILSTEVRAGVFRFVDIDELLEIEAGFSTNEPPQMCVLEGLEKAVISLIIEGVLSGAWELEDPSEMQTNPIIQAYMQERGGFATAYADEVGESLTLPQGETYDPEEETQSDPLDPSDVDGSKGGGPAIEGPSSENETPDDATQVSETTTPTAGPFLVTAPAGAVVREKPDNNAPTLDVLPPNTLVHVASTTEDGWRYVLHSKGAAGYTPANGLEPAIR